MSSLSLVIIHDPYLDIGHLNCQIEALNQQDCQAFDVIYLNQSRETRPLRDALAKAHFPYLIFDIPYPYLNEVCCWDLVRVMAIVCENLKGEYLSYLHKECLPHPQFVSDTLTGIAQCESETGSADNIYMLNQLRSPLTLEKLEPDKWLSQIDTPDAISWIDRRPISRDYIYQSQSWQEDAFAIPLALIEKLQLFKAVQQPLYFQDLFDIFLQLEDQSFAQYIHWYRLGKPVIFHLNHAREFREYRQAFLAQVLTRPDLFGHLALYELAASDFDYREPFEGQERQIQTQLHAFVHFMRYSEKGTVTLWLQSLIEMNISISP